MNEISVSAGVSLTLSVFLLVLSGFFSASEIAFFSLSPDDIEEIEEGGSETDRRICFLRDSSESLLATILVANNVVNVSIIILLDSFFHSVVDFGGNVLLEYLVLTVLLTFLLLLFGEIIPKIYSASNPLPLCRFATPIIYLLQRLFRPLTTLLVRSTVIADKVVQKADYSLSSSELSEALSLTDKREISDNEKMLKGIIRIGDETAKDIMTSRTDILAFDIKTSFADVVNSIVENNYSRIPVYQGSLDNIKGVMYIKDLLPHLAKPKSFRWQSLVRPPYYVPETKKIDDLLNDFQQNRVHIAIVVDEFGGTSGIVTMEDILEEVVGEIQDEYDDENKSYVRQSDGTYIFDAKISIAEFSSVLSVGEDFFSDMDDVDTLAGLVLELKGDFPVRGELLQFKNLSIVVLELEQRRISKVKVSLDADFSA